jgi:hypothetical protein
LATDYSLFIFSRFGEELKENNQVSQIIRFEKLASLHEPDFAHVFFFFSSLSFFFQDSVAAIINSMNTAGETILISGTTLCICFLGLTLLPLTFLQVCVLPHFPSQHRLHLLSISCTFLLTCPTRFSAERFERREMFHVRLRTMEI